MEAEKRPDFAQATLAGSAWNDGVPEDVGARSKFVLGTLAGLAMGVPASFVSVMVVPKALAGPAAVLMVALCIVPNFRPRPAPAAALRHGWAIFFSAAASTICPLFAWFLVSNWLAGLWPIFRFPPH